MRGITIQADKTRMLRFSINAMIEYKQTKGEDIMKALARLEKDFDFELFRYLFYVGLKHEDKELTAELPGENIDILFVERRIAFVATILGDAIAKAFGVKEAPGVSHSKNQ